MSSIRRLPPIGGGIPFVVTFGSIPGEYDVYVHDGGGNSAVKAFKRLYVGRPVKS